MAEVHAQSASAPVRFHSGTDGIHELVIRPVRSQIEGLQGVPTTTAVPSAALAESVPLSPRSARAVAPTTTTTAAPTTTTTAAPAPPPPAPAPAPAPKAAATGGGDPSDPATWDRLARCEASGNWAANTGNGYYGGLQFSASTWRSVGGTGLPHQSSRATQIEMGKRLQARQGWGAWPACSRRLGYR
jgi:hypothetical protein